MKTPPTPRRALSTVIVLWGLIVMVPGLLLGLGVTAVTTVASPPPPAPAIAPTTWSHARVDADGVGVFRSHVQTWNEQTGEWSTQLWTHTLVRPGDMNGDLRVDTSDLGAFLRVFPAVWQPGDENVGDFNGDGRTDTEDLGILLSEFRS
ncbi:MAG: hypothetical protein H6826_14465 [Planctomycetes bacterium]|nr:hypothetical protein [Planctomycetota bacterium]